MADDLAAYVPPDEEFPIKQSFDPNDPESYKAFQKRPRPWLKWTIKLVTLEVGQSLTVPSGQYQTTEGDASKNVRTCCWGWGRRLGRKFATATQLNGSILVTRIK